MINRPRVASGKWALDSLLDPAELRRVIHPGLPDPGRLGRDRRVEIDIAENCEAHHVGEQAAYLGLQGISADTVALAAAQLAGAHHDRVSHQVRAVDPSVGPNRGRALDLFRQAAEAALVRC